ncbi:MAG TPA: hypothetical protein VHL50_07580 [Pyrinomonadaceae bacterium]|nr:hypothetical protein [Pyrinomonadaceae bacterium]
MAAETNGHLIVRTVNAPELQPLGAAAVTVAVFEVGSALLPGEPDAARFRDASRKHRPKIFTPGFYAFRFGPSKWSAPSRIQNGELTP